MNFERIIKLKQASLKHELDRELRGMGYTCIVNDTGFLYAEGSHPVLLVAHLDTVHTSAVKTICKSDDGDVWMSPEGIGGDDRCGVYMVLEIAKKINCSVLFCEDEEIGGRGASAFVSSGIIPNANYIVEFDRKGNNDAVFYDCDNPEFTDFVEGFGFKENWGSFSDISFVAPALKIAAVNLSSGYHDAHTRYEHIVISEMEDVIERATEMIQTETGQFEYIEAKWNYKSNYKTSYKNYSDFGLKSISNNGWSGNYNYDSFYDLDDYYNFNSSFGVTTNAKDDEEDVGMMIWDEDVCKFHGALYSDEGDYMEADFDGYFYINEDEDVFEESADGDVILVMEGWHPYTHDGVTNGFNKEYAKTRMCMYEEDYYNYMFGGEEEEAV